VDNTQIPVGGSRDGFMSRTQLGYTDGNCGLSGSPHFISNRTNLAGGMIGQGLYRDGQMYIPDLDETNPPLEDFLSVWSIHQGCEGVNQPDTPAPLAIPVGDFSTFVPPFHVSLE